MAILTKFEGSYYQLIPTPDNVGCSFCYFHNRCMNHNHPSCTRTCNKLGYTYNHAWRKYNKMIQKGDKIIKI